MATISIGAWSWTPILSHLRDDSAKPPSWASLPTGTLVYLAFFPSIQVIMVRERLGTTRPMHCSAPCKAYLSALDDRALDSELAVLNYRKTRTAPRGGRSSWANA
jgi:DNA-binding IclR family transcriptional regulator